MGFSAEPKQLKRLSGKAHGTELFAGPHREEFTRTLLDFVRARLQ